MRQGFVRRHKTTKAPKLMLKFGQRNPCQSLLLHLQLVGNWKLSGNEVKDNWGNLL